MRNSTIIGVVLAAELLSSVVPNELRKFFMFDVNGLFMLGLTCYTLAAALVITVSGKPSKPAPIRISPIFSVIGAFALIFIFTGVWKPFVAEIDPIGKIFGQPEPSVSATRLAPVLKILIMIVAPISEEIICRQGLLRTLSRVAPKWLALLISSLVFTAGHYAVYSPGQLVTILVTGLLLGLTYLYFGLLYSILLHLLLNAWPWVSENWLDSEPFIAVIVVLFLIGIAVFAFEIVRSRKSVFG